MTVQGNAESSVRVVAYVDLQCPDCASYSAMLDDHLIPRYGTEVAFEFHHFPLPKHSWARQAAVAAVAFAAVQPELGLAFEKLCFRQQREISSENIASVITGFADLRGVDIRLDDRSFAAMVQSEYNEGVARGVERTPTVFVADKVFIETFTSSDLAAGIERAFLPSITSQ